MYLEGDLQVVMLVVVISMFLTYILRIDKKKNRIYNSQPATNFDDTHQRGSQRLDSSRYKVLWVIGNAYWCM